MKEYIPCPVCLTVNMRYDKIVEHGRTLQVVCPACGKLDHFPVWGRRKTKPTQRSSGDAERFLQMAQSTVRLKSLTPKYKRRK